VTGQLSQHRVLFRTEDTIKLTDEKFTSISKDDRKLRCNHIIPIEAQYSANESLFHEGQETAVHVENDNSEVTAI
jgi:hypothetical protein